MIWAADPLPRDCFGGVDDRVVGCDRRQRALEHDQRAEEGAPLRGQGDPEVEEQAEHRVEHGGVGAGAGREVLGHEARQRALEVGDVDTTTEARDLEHRLGDRVGVAPAHPRHQLAERGLLHGVEAAGRAEVDEREAPVAQEHHVAGVRVGVEHALLQHLLEERAKEQVGDLRALRRRARRPTRRRARSRRRATPSRARASVLSSSYTSGTTTRDPSGQVAADRARVARLDAEVELLAQAGAELVDEVHHVVLGAPRRAGLDDPTELVEHREVDGHRLVDPGADDLDHHRGTVGQRGPVYLTDRRGRDRIPVELREHVIDRCVELLLEHLGDVVAARRLHLVLEQRELLDDVGRQESRSASTAIWPSFTNIPPHCSSEMRRRRTVGARLPFGEMSS